MTTEVYVAHAKGCFDLPAINDVLLFFAMWADGSFLVGIFDLYHGLFTQDT
ncbi:MAG: hypothetical protein P8L44_22265 [Opitutales bacterium]|nr:hypothetical protein [Opitutales bacterium]MDG2170642.1 hypothetical protein [Opitutales bacterium]